MILACQGNGTGTVEHFMISPWPSYRWRGNYCEKGRVGVATVKGIKWEG
jgi:hypothetical protein